ncbi:MAG: hypothetical protein AAFZ52_16045 [Bacteroidota bacterium]
MRFLRLFLTVLCAVPTLFFAQTDVVRIDEIKEIGPDDREIIVDPVTDPVSDFYPCHFDWAALEVSDGSTVNFMEDKGCQPFQGPCVAFSYVKVMEAQLNFATSNACRSQDYSISWFDYAGWTPSGYYNFINAGRGIPAAGCGMFQPECTDIDRAGSNCHCVHNMIKNQATNEDLCFTVDATVQEPGQDLSCQELYTVDTSPMTSEQMFANSATNLYPTSIAAIKDQLIQHGPLVAIVQQGVLGQFRDYDDIDKVSFHSFVITGWRDMPLGRTVWLIDDHWPGSAGAFCGPGETKRVVNSDLLQYIDEDDVRLVKISGVYTTPSCTGTVASFAVEDQNDCAYLEDVCVVTTVPVITDLYTTSSRPCLTSGTLNRVLATADCQGVPADELEFQWMVSPGGFSSPSVSGCGAQAFVVPTNLHEVFVRVRARFGPNCSWSEWYWQDFCVESKGGGGNGNIGGLGGQ